MNKKLFISIVIVLIFAVGLTISSSMAVNLGTITVKNSGTKLVKLNNAPDFVATPKVYEYGYNNTTHTIKTKKVKGVNKDYTFKTKFFLNKKIGTNVQSATIKGNNLYTLVMSGSNKGFIARYNLAKFNKDGVINAMPDKIGPKFVTGHGQSLTLNPKDGYFYMWQDNPNAKEKWTMLRINPNTLKPSNSYTFKLKLNGNILKRTNRNLAFDKQGNFYTELVYTATTSILPKGAVNILRGSVSNGKLKFYQGISAINKYPGGRQQSISINPVSNRLYLVSDDVFYTMPINKVFSGTLTQKDMQYTVLNTKREFEGIFFDTKGTNYLLALKYPEILKAN